MDYKIDEVKVAGNSCINCGQQTNVKRIDRHYIMHEIEHVLHFERGILYTIRELLVRPGENVRYFISEDRSRLVKPVIFIIVTSLIYSLITHFFHLEQGYVNYDEKKESATGVIFKWVQDHYGYGNIIMGIFIALWVKVFFKKYAYNFFEILILLCFAMGIAMLIFAISAIIQGLTQVDLTQIASVVGIGYCSWAIGQFFDKKRIVNYIKALAAYMLGMITFTAAAIMLGALIELMIKH